jgi:protein phosphatase
MRSAADAVAPRLTFASLTDIGKVRSHNEDFLGDPRSMSAFTGDHTGLSRMEWLFAVADGMGGHADGEVASCVAVEALFSSYYASAEEPPFALAGAMAAANEAVCRAAERDAQPSSSRSRMGTTLVAAVLGGPRIVVGNVGDSRAYLLVDGRLRQVTLDHSFVAEQVELGLISAQEARRAPLRNVLTRALGSEEGAMPDLFEVSWGTGGVFLLCTDGLHGVVEDRTIEAVLAEDPPDRAVRRLIDAANAAGGPDNISAIVVRTDGGSEGRS